MYKIGFLVATTPQVWKRYSDAFEDQLKTNHGWIKNTHYTIDLQPPSGAMGEYVKYVAAAKNFVAQTNPPVDIIVTAGTAPTKACKDETNTGLAPGQKPIPVVFASAGDPVGCNLVASLGHPGGNVTGLWNKQADPSGSNNLVKDRLQRLKDNAKLGSKFCVGIIGNDSVCNVQEEMRLAQTAASDLGLTLPTGVSGSIQTSGVIGTVITNLQKAGAQALFVCSDPLLTTYADTVNDAANSNKLPTMHAFSEYLDHKYKVGLMSYGPDFKKMFRDAADRVYMILHDGVLPAAIPVIVQRDGPEFHDSPVP
jgi:putative ABC transport system substrate-binding protein